MYRIANVTTRDGKTVKPERIGRLIYQPRFDTFNDGTLRMYGVYVNVPRNKMLVTSPVLMDTFNPETKDITVVTENSVYTLEYTEKAE